MRQELEIHGPLPGLNELIDAAKRGRTAGGVRHDRYTRLKRRWTAAVAAVARAAGLQPVERAWLRFVWREPDRRRDPDNVAAGGRKLVLDGLVAAGVLPGDGWRAVAGWKDEFVVDAARPGVTVEIVACAGEENRR